MNERHSTTVLQTVEKTNKKHGKDMNAVARALYEAFCTEFPIAVRPVRVGRSLEI